MKYPLSKYKIVEHKNKNGDAEILAISTYAGKTVRGVAICHPDDNYSSEQGAKLAAARCNLKIAGKRVKRAEMKVREAQEMVARAQKHYEDMVHYLEDSSAEQSDAYNELETMLNQM